MVRASLAVRFNQYVFGDLFFLWDKTWLMLVDDCLRWRMAARLHDKTARAHLDTSMAHWFRYFGPMEVWVFDQDSAITSDMATLTCDRYSITRKLAGERSVSASSPP